MIDTESTREIHPNEEIISFAARSTTREDDMDDDTLLVEIDAFRDKAQKLQELINAKQERVSVLERLVADKEVQNNRLQEELKKRQRQADGLLADVESQMDRLEKAVMANMDNMEERIRAQVERIEQQQTASLPILPEQLDFTGVSDEISTQIKSMEGLFAGQQEKMDASFEGQQKRIDDTFAKQQKQLDQSLMDHQKKLSDTITLQSKQMEEALAKSQKHFDETLSSQTQSFENIENIDGALSEQKEFLQTSLGDHERELKNGISDVRRDIDGMKSELSEKIHTEDVKVYRNLQDFMKEQDHRDEDVKDIKTKYVSLRNRMYLIMFLTFVNIALSVFFLLIIV